MPEQRPDADQEHRPDTERHPTGAVTEGGSRYRSLRGLSGASSGPRSAVPRSAPAAGPWRLPGDHRQESQPTPWAAQPAPARRGGLRHIVLGAVAMLLLVGLAWAGYLAYRQFAPYYGLGYAAGGTGTVRDVTFRVLDAKCGLPDPPSTSATPVKGQFCVVEVRALNNSDQARYLNLSMFAVELDTGTRANPARTAMVTLSTKLTPGQNRALELVYDVWEGVRMDTLKVQIGFETTNIPLT